MDYVEIGIKCNDDIKDILSARLWQLGCESFMETSNGINAYILQANYHSGKIREILTNYQLRYTTQTVPPQNWNRQWEENFKPISVEDKVRIRASFHARKPEFTYDIVIDPKMSFGTGHHETTRLMISSLMALPVETKSILDVGCGTGILGILAEKIGAARVTAIDCDPHAVSNARENVGLNQCVRIKILAGTVNELPNTRYQIITANINRNVLLEEIPAYCKYLEPGGYLIMSGFYTDDQPLIVKKSEAHQLVLKAKSSENNWACLVFEK